MMPFSVSCLYFLLSEEGEIHTAIRAMFEEMGMLREVVRLAMFQHEEAIRLEEVACKDDVGQFSQIGQGVWRIGKDEVELLIATSHIAEDIGADSHACLILQLLQETTNKTVVQTVLLDADDT